MPPSILKPIAPPTLLEHFRRNIRQGLALASLYAAGGCGDDAKSTENLDPYPVDMLGCWGEQHDGGYFGQCCVEALCYSPDDGVCASSEEAPPLLSDFPPGSGACGCNLSEDADTGIAGPFAPNAEDSPPEGDCCYLVGSITCTGRPLVVEGEIVIAALVVRSDWTAFA